MGTLKFIHFGDLHLDSGFVLSGFSELEAKVRRQELKDVFVRIIDKVIELGVELLLISGDFFEHEYVSKSTIDLIVRHLNRIPDVKVFISPGNHDPFAGNSYYSLAEWPDNVHIFGKDFNCVNVESLNTIIYGAGFTAKTQYETMLDVERFNKAMCNFGTSLNGSIFSQENPVKILLMHGTIDGDSSQCPYNPISSKDINELGFNYTALGHYHKNKGYLNKRIIYCGSPEPLGFDEPGEHGIIFGTIDDDGKMKTEFIKMNTREYVAIEIDISDISSQDMIEECVADALKGNRDNYVNIIFKGAVTLTLNLDAELLISRFENACRYIKITDNTSYGSSIGEIIGFNNIKGIFAKIVMEKIEEAEDAEEREKMRQALKLGLEALDI